LDNHLTSFARWLFEFLFFIYITSNYEVIMNKFNRILLASGLAATAALMANSPAFADTTGKVDLSGTVPSTLAVTVSPSAGASSLDLSPGTRIAKIGTITGVATNSPSGLKVTATSTWKLVRSGAQATDVAIGVLNVYQASGASATVHTWQLDSAPQVNQAIELIYTKSTGPGSAPDSSFFIALNLPTNYTYPAGTYTGSITFTATDK
jgi:hypothetical protein